MTEVRKALDPILRRRQRRTAALDAALAMPEGPERLAAFRVWHEGASCDASLLAAGALLVLEGRGYDSARLVARAHELVEADKVIL